MQLNTDFKLAGPLAGLFGGITQAQEQERMGLANAYQGLKNQEQQYTSAEAQAKMQDPQYIQMKLQNDMAKFGKETSINEIESAYNKANIAVAHLQAAQAQGPQALQQAAVSYLQQMNIDPNSEKGQMLLKDPVGNAQKLAQFYATAATNNADYLQKYNLQDQKGQQDMDIAKYKGGIDIQKANIGAAASDRAAEKGLRGQMLTYSGQLRSELDNINNNLTKIEGKEAEAAIIQDFMSRNNGKQPTEQDVAAKKTELRTALETRKRNLETELDSVRGEVRGKLGMKQGDGTAGKPIKLD